MPTIILNTDYQKADHQLQQCGLWSDNLRYKMAEAIALEREACARIVETALREDFKAKCGQPRGPSEAEAFLAKAIREGRYATVQKNAGKE